MESRGHSGLSQGPTFNKAIGSFKASDLLLWGGIVAVAAPYGYYLGKPARRQTMVMAVGLGLAGGFVIALQRSYWRIVEQEAAALKGR